VVELVCVIPQSVNGKHGVFHATDNDPNVPGVFMRRGEQAFPIKRGASPGVRKQD
jgi:hypothetical protein